MQVLCRTNGNNHGNIFEPDKTWFEYFKESTQLLRNDTNLLNSNSCEGWKSIVPWLLWKHLTSTIFALVVLFFIRGMSSSRQVLPQLEDSTETKSMPGAENFLAQADKTQMQALEHWEAQITLLGSPRTLKSVSWILGLVQTQLWEWPLSTRPLLQCCFRRLHLYCRSWSYFNACFKTLATGIATGLGKPKHCK